MKLLTASKHARKEMIETVTALYIIDSKYSFRSLRHSYRSMTHTIQIVVQTHAKIHERESKNKGKLCLI